MAFTTAQMVDIRRFMGYEAFGTGPTGYFFGRTFTEYNTLEYRMNNLQPEEETVVITIYLANLYTLETAIVNASAMLNVGSAAVFTRNAKEMDERNALFDNWRRKLCQFFGLPFGPGLGGTGMNGSVECII
jgi:hypothetical protein